VVPKRELLENPREKLSGNPKLKPKEEATPETPTLPRNLLNLLNRLNLLNLLNLQVKRKQGVRERRRVLRLRLKEP
jgi:hypothetical protein